MARSNWFTPGRTPTTRRQTKRSSSTSRRRKTRAVEPLENRLLLAADVFTDQVDYAPGQTAHIYASDFAAGEAVQFQVLHIDGTPNTGNGHLPWTVVDGSADDLDGVVNGNIHTTWYVDPDDSAGATFELTAQGLSSGELAETVFTDDGNGTPTNITTQPGWLDVNGTNPATVINAPAGFVITKVAIKSGSNSFAVPDPDNVDPGDDNTGDQHSGVIYVDGTYGLGNGFTVSGLGTATVTVTKNAGTKDISHVDYMLGEQPDDASKSGMKFHDHNANGVKDVGDEGLSNWEIRIYEDTNGNDLLDQAEFNAGAVATQLTGANGQYAFNNLDADDYIVVEVLQVGWFQSFPGGSSVLAAGLNTGAITLGAQGYAITLTSGQQDTGNDFGNFQNATKSGMKFHDRNANGVKDIGDEGLAGWVITLAGIDGMGTPIVLVTATDANGNYSFTVKPGTYTVSESQQPGWIQSYPDIPGDGDWDIVLTSGQNDTGNDFGNFQNATKSGMKFNDHNANGVKDPGDEGLSGWTINLVGTDGMGNAVNLSTVTDANGNYTFTVKPGTYTVSEVQQPGWVQTYPDIPGDGDWDITLASGQNDTGNDFGNHKCSVIVIGPDKGNKSDPIIRIVDSETGEIVSQFYVYEPSFKGGVRIATGDMTGDGIDEIIVAPGQGRSPQVRVFTQTGVELVQFRTLAYDVSHKGGVEVAVGDVNGDGKNDIITTPTNARTQVRVFFNNYDSGMPLADPISNTPDIAFYVFDSKFKGGADVTVADVGTFLNGATIDANTPDGKSEIIVGSGPGMRATVQVFDVTGAPTIVDTILPFANNFKGGVTLSTARVNADAIPDLIIAAGNKGGSAIEIYSGLANDTPDVLLAAFAAFADVPTKNMPVHATAFDTDGDGIADVLAAVQGTNGKSNEIRFFDLDGNFLDALTGFNGPWNIASLNGFNCDLPDDAATLVVNDTLFAQLADEFAKPKKKKKK